MKSKTQEDFIFYKWMDQTFEYSRGVEAYTSNRFHILSEEEDQISSEEEIILPCFNNVMLNNDVCFLDKNYYVFNKNINFCSGYFPSYISLNCNKLNLISQDSSLKNIKNNYYIKVKDKKYLKQVVNRNGKYNFSYFNGMKEYYQIGNIHSKQLGNLDSYLQIENRKKLGKKREITPHHKRSTVCPRTETKNWSQEEGLDSEAISRDRESDQEEKEHSRKKKLKKTNRTQDTENNGNQMNHRKTLTTYKLNKVANFSYTEIKNVNRKKNKDENNQTTPHKEQNKTKEKKTEI